MPKLGTKDDGQDYDFRQRRLLVIDNGFGQPPVVRVHHHVVRKAPLNAQIFVQQPVRCHATTDSVVSGWTLRPDMDAAMVRRYVVKYFNLCSVYVQSMFSLCSV